MQVLFFIGDTGWTARARIFTAAAQGLASRGHDVTIACPPGPVVERVDATRVHIVRIDPAANAALGSFDFRRVAQERSIDVVFVHTAREQLVVGSGLRFARGGAVLRRVGMFDARDDEPGLLTSRVAPARIIVSSNPEAAAMINAGGAPPFVAPLGVDAALASSVAPLDRHALRVPDDAMLIACPYALNGRPRLLNMMRSMALLASRHPKLRAVIFGERATDDELRMQAAALGVAPLVQFVDAAKVDPVALLKASDVAWIAADGDPAALGCLDAMAAARSVIAERSPTIEYFVADGINGTVLQESAEPSTIAAAAANALARTSVRDAQGHAGFSRLERELGLAPMIDGFERAAQGAQAMGAGR